MSKDEAIGMLTNQTNRKIVRYLNSNLEKFDVTTEQWNVLLRLSREKDGINQKQLALKSDKDQPTIVRILDILERKKFIERNLSKEDRRAFIICITEEGKQLVNEAEPFIESLFEKILNGISNEKLEIYIEVLMSISENIKINMNCNK